MNVETRSQTRMAAQSRYGTQPRPVYVDRVDPIVVDLIPATIQIDLTPAIEDEPEEVSWFDYVTQNLPYVNRARLEEDAKWNAIPFVNFFQ